MHKVIGFCGTWNLHLFLTCEHVCQHKATSKPRKRRLSDEERQEKYEEKKAYCKARYYRLKQERLQGDTLEATEMAGGKKGTSTKDKKGASANKEPKKVSPKKAWMEEKKVFLKDVVICSRALCH